MSDALDKLLRDAINESAFDHIPHLHKRATDALRELARLRAIAEAAEEMAEVLTDIPDDDRVGDILSSYRRAKEAE